MFETCNYDYESPPEGVPTWCVQLDTGWETCTIISRVPTQPYYIY